MQQRKENEFEWFQKTNKEWLAKIKGHIDAKEDYYGSNWSSDMYGFNDECPSSRMPAYLMAALLKQRVNYGDLYDCCITYISGLSIGFDCGPASPQTIQWRKEREKETKRLQKEMIHGIELAPLIAHSVCDYDTMDAWLSSHRESEPNNPYVKIIDRFKLLNEVPSYDFDSEEPDTEKYIKCLRKKRDAVLTLLSQDAKNYPALCKEIDIVMKSEVKVTILGACIEFADASKIHNIIFLLTDLELRQLANVANTKVSAVSMFPACKEDGSGLNALTQVITPVQTHTYSG